MDEIKKQPGIYKITNPKGKIYIGQSRNIKKRYNDYKSIGAIRQTRLHNSFLKYSFNNHIFEIKEYCNFELLNIRERYWQDYYNVIGKNGLNCNLTNTNEKPLVWSENSKKLCSNSRIQYNLENINEPIYQFDLKGNLLKVWKNRTEVKLTYPTINSTNLHRCLADNKNGLFLNEFIWSLKSILSKEFLIKVDNLLIKKDNQIIYQYDLSGNFIKSWKNEKEIINTLGFRVSQCVNHRNLTAHGYIWKSKNYTLTKLDLLKIKQNKNEQSKQSIS